LMTTNVKSCPRNACFCLSRLIASLRSSSSDGGLLVSELPYGGCVVICPG
jgi:hypothetical protein